MKIFLPIRIRIQRQVQPAPWHVSSVRGLGEAKQRRQSRQRAAVVLYLVEVSESVGLACPCVCQVCRELAVALNSHWNNSSTSASKCEAKVFESFHECLWNEGMCDRLREGGILEDLQHVIFDDSETKG